MSPRHTHPCTYILYVRKAAGKLINKDSNGIIMCFSYVWTELSWKKREVSLQQQDFLNDSPDQKQVLTDDFYSIAAL